MVNKELTTTPDLINQIEYERAQRTAIKAFVAEQLIENRDFIKIKGKDVLAKPGMEKILSLFRVKSRLFKDTETLEMIGKPGVIAYRCELYRTSERGEEVIAEGRGACSLSEKPNENTTIKIAEKRARMDACLSLGFSEYFTQDLDDMPLEESAVERQEKRIASLVQEVPEDGEYTIFVEKVYAGTTKKGEPYKALKTDVGRVMAWKETEQHFREGGSYTVYLQSGAVKSLIEPT